MKIKTIFSITLIVLLLVSILIGCEQIDPVDPVDPDVPAIIDKPSKIKKFSSGEELLKAFEDARDNRRGGILEAVAGIAGTVIKGGMQSMAEADTATARDFSETNIQVEGVDEADIIKTDGTYIYTLAKGKLVIVRAYPENNARILSTTALGEFSPRELFIHNDKLLVFGSTSYRFEETSMIGEVVEEIAPPQRRYVGVMSLRLYDISDRRDPELLRTVDVEGNYITSRKIGEHAYFVVNSYPQYYRGLLPTCEKIVPLYRESTTGDTPTIDDMEPIAKCTDIGYIEPIQATNFITISSISMEDETAKVQRETIVGSGQNVYASLGNLYIAQTSWPRYDKLGELLEEYYEKTIVTKFELDDGEITFDGKGEVKGHILNQFSMDEYDRHFRIATTRGQVWNNEVKSSNNVYVLDDELEVVGELEDLAPGERIYSVRFMGKKGYVVTFKKVDPLFVIDLSDHDDPRVLGKLKIPGYSDYLHPFDENHIIGIGKDTEEASEELTQGRGLDFAWYQGVKMAIFDVSDVENPIEMHKVVIGDRGTDSEALHNHKAFLFDRERELLVLPITLAEIKGEKTRDNQYGEYTFQGAYVYDINLRDGFDLRGRVTHYDSDEVFLKSGYYFRGDSAIRRSLYIEDVLYTLSDTRLQLNDLYDLDRLEVLEFS